jgi:dipeptidyl aminopeptidase/acylaminoacyl peptidase
MFRSGLALVFACALLAAPKALAAPPPVEAYGKLPAVENVSLSPSGRSFALISVDGEKRALVVATTADDKPVYGLDVSGLKVVGVDWAGEDHLLVTISGTVPLGFDFAVSKAEFTGVLVINVKTKKMVSVFKDHSQVAHVVAGTYGTAEIGGHWYGFFGGITYGGGAGSETYIEHMYPDLYRVDLDTGEMMLVAMGTDNGAGWLLDPSGVIVARATYDSKRGDWAVKTGERGGVVLDSGNDPFGGAAMSLGRTRNELVIRRPSPSGEYDETVPLTGGTPAPVPDDDKIDGLAHDPRTGLWDGYSSFDDVPVLKMFDPAIDAKIRGTRKAFPDQSVRFVSWADDFNRIVVFTSGGDDAGTYWMVDIAKGGADPIGFEYPQVKPEDVGPIRMVDWKAADGLQLHGVLSLPPGRAAKNLPVIVMPHGGPQARDYPVFDWWAQLFASRGYAVFQPNFRGSSGYGAKFRDAGFGEWGRKMQTDTSDGLAELVKQGIVDPKRACIVGASYGGYAALAGVTVEQGLYRCAVSMAGLSDLGSFLDYQRDKAGREASESERYWKAFMGVTTFWESELKPISPARLASRADAPILLIHGKDDTVVPFDQSQEMASALRSAGKPVELVTLPNADHWLLHEDTRLAMARASIEFVLKYNPPDPDPAPSATAAK